MKKFWYVLALLFPGVALATPERITTLAVVWGGTMNATFSFTMPAPGVGLTVTQVECRQSDVPISTLNWGTRLLIPNQPSPTTPRTLVNFGVQVPYDRPTFIGCKTRDTTWSLLSNVVWVAPSAPATINAVLEWTQPNDARIDGYYIYWREKTAGVYNTTNRTFVGLTSSAIVPVWYGTLWCFSLTSVDTDTLSQSAFSNEACKTSPYQ